MTSFIPMCIRKFFSGWRPTNTPPSLGESNIDSSALSSNRWLQGKILDKQFVSYLAHIGSLPSPNENEIWIVVSQSCDLLNHSFENEPFAEVIKATLIDTETSKQLLFNKNPRILECEAAFESDPSQSTKLSIHDRVLLKRSLFADHEPASDLELKQETIRNITRWISNRYIRPAFPDAFNMRAKKELDNIGKKSSFRTPARQLTGIWINTEDQEIDDNQEYTVEIIATMKSDDFADNELNKEAVKALNKFEGALSKCYGIEIKDSILLPESKFSIEDFHNSKHWDFDYLSISDGEPAPLDQK